MSDDALANGERPGRTGPEAEPASERLPPVPVPDHVLLRCIGRGSYGEVWLARNIMGAYRAVKIVYRRSFKDQRPFDREWSGIRKFEPISRSHVGFVHVLHVGMNEAQGYFYYVMELGDDVAAPQQGGGTKPASEHGNQSPLANKPALPKTSSNPQLSPSAHSTPEQFGSSYVPKTLAREIARRGKLSFAECLEFGLALSDALVELHKHGLIHRDIKPSNIIFVNGAPKLADIGLVADADEALSYVGTEGFIPPEGPGKAQADVYGLGKVLYEASTGKDRQDFPELPAEWDRSPEHSQLLELNEVVLQACNHDPNERYRSAGELHADLVVLANGKSVKRLKLLERRLSNLKRIASITSGIFLVLGIIAFQIYQQWKRTVESRQQQVGQNVAYGNRALEAGDLTGASPYFAEALRLEGGNPAHASLSRLRYGCVQAQCPRIVQLWSLSNEVDTVSFSPDDRRLLVVELLGRARIFDVGTGLPVTPPFGQTYLLRHGAYRPDGTLVATASEDTTVCLWNANDGTKLFDLKHASKAMSSTFSPDSSQLVTGCKDGDAWVWDLHTRALKFLLKGHTDEVKFAAFNLDGSRIVTAGIDHTARLWNATNGEPIGKPLPHPNWVVYGAFSPDGRTLVTACGDHKAYVWDVERGERIPPDLEHDDWVASAEFSPDGRLIVTASYDHTARLWLTDTHEPLRPNPLLRHSDRVTHARFSHDGHRIATTCIDGTVRIWDLAGGAVAPAPESKALSEDFARFVTVTPSQLQVWDTASRRPVSPLIQPQRQLKDAKLNFDGSFVLTVSGSAHGTNDPCAFWEVFETSSGRRLGPPLPLTNSVAKSSLSRDGKRILVWETNLAHAWDVLAGTPLSKPVVHAEVVESAVFSPDGKAVASWSGGTTRVWNPSTGQELFGPLTLPVTVTHVEFNPAGTRLVTCGADNYLTKCYAQVWDLATGQPVGSRLKHDDGVLWADFSPDGSRIATSGEDFSARVWKTATGKPLTSRLKHAHQVSMTAFSPNGKCLVTASVDRSVRIWDPETGDPLTPPLRHVVRPRTARFLADSRRLVTVDVFGGVRQWELPSDDRPVDDLIALSRLLAGDTVTPPGMSDMAPAEAPQALWQRLRAKYPAEFSVTDSEVEAWHQFQAERAEFQAGRSQSPQEWSAAVFHLKRLLTLRPGDQEVANRLARANEQLERAKSLQ